MFLGRGPLVDLKGNQIEENHHAVCSHGDIPSTRHVGGFPLMFL